MQIRFAGTVLGVFLWLASVKGFAQDHSFNTYLQNGKAEFGKPHEEQDYALAVANLEKAVQLKPGSAEAHYFLGYAYDRLNSKDGRSMGSQQLPLALKASREMEQVIKLTPKYTGELVVLDPYSKLTSVWGSQAMSYLAAGKTDSARWAFSEGRKRKGFSDCLLEFNRNILRGCAKNALLFVSGDNLTIPMWYLQTMEHLRPDVSVISTSLLNSGWYPQYLLTEKQVRLTYSGAVLDSLEYIVWPADTTVSVAVKSSLYPGHQLLTWHMQPSYQEQYILRGDRLMLDILQVNRFERPVYFAASVGKQEQISLTDFLHDTGLAFELKPYPAGQLPESYFRNLESIDYRFMQVPGLGNSPDLGFLADTYRYQHLIGVQQLYNQDKIADAKVLFRKMKQRLPESVLPMSKELKEGVVQFEKILNQTGR